MRKVVGGFGVACQDACIAAQGIDLSNDVEVIMGHGASYLLSGGSHALCSADVWSLA